MRPTARRLSALRRFHRRGGAGFCAAWIAFAVACSETPQIPDDADRDDVGVLPDATPAAPEPLDTSADAPPLDATPDIAEEPVVWPPTLDGPWRPGRTRFAVYDATRDRTLPVEVWYPTESDAADVGIGAFGRTAEESAQLEALLADAPEGCPRDVFRAAEGPMVEGLALAPLALLSHCHGCTRFNLATTAERLATHGWVVAAPDHVGNTLFDSLAGDLAPLSAEFLETRGEDLRAVLNALLDADASVPDAVRGRIDADRVGAVGHSFGAVSVAWLAERDPRVKALVAIAAPIENPLLPGVTASAITVPTLFVLAVEDNSILSVGNRLLRDNYEAMGGPAALLAIDDAGHWSVSDLNGLVDAFSAGCGEARRQTRRSETFRYLDPPTGRRWTADWVTIWLQEVLSQDAAARQARADGPEPGSRWEERDGSAGE